MKKRIKQCLLTLFYIQWINFDFSLREFQLSLINFGIGEFPDTQDFNLFKIQLILPINHNYFNFQICLFGNQLELTYWKKEWHLFYSRLGDIIKCIPKYKKEEI